MDPTQETAPPAQAYVNVEPSKAPVWVMFIIHSGLRVMKPILPKAWSSWLDQVALFVFMGVTNNVIAYLVFVALLNLADWHRHWALLATYITGMLIGYITFSRYVFINTARYPFWRYLGAYVFLFGVNRILLEVLVVLGHMYEEIAQLALLIPIAALSYLVNRFWVFSGGVKQ